MKKFLAIMLWLVLPTMLFAQQWETILPDSIFIVRGFINEDNSTEYVGYSDHSGLIVKMADDGQYEVTAFPAPDGKRLILDNLIPLDEGYFVSGIAEDGSSSTGDLKIMVLDKELTIANEQTIQVQEGFYGFQVGAAVMDDDGTIVLLATAKRETPSIPGTFQFIGVLFRFSQGGECLGCHYLMPTPQCYLNQIYNQKMQNDPYSDMTIAMCHGQSGPEAILYFDYDLNLVADYFIEDLSLPEWGDPGRRLLHPYSNHWLTPDELMVIAVQHDSNSSIDHPHILVGRMNREGGVFDKIEIVKQDTLMYTNQSDGGMAYANDSTIYVLARCNTDNFVEPYYPQIYLLNTELEILGCLSFWDDLNYWPRMVLPTSDDGCIFVSNSTAEGNTFQIKEYYFRRFSREDFNPVWSVSERPLAEAKASLYPNPAKDEIHIDLAEVPTDGSVRLRIANMGGQTFIDRRICGTGNLLTVGVAALPPGTYAYTLYDNEKTLFTGKFIKD